MKHRIIFACAAIASVMAVVVAPAQAVKHHESKVVFEGSEAAQSNPDLVDFVVGRVVSNDKCKPNRTVKILFHYEGTSGFQPVDTAKSGHSGTFAGEGFIDEGNGNLVDAAKFVLKPKTIGSGHHREVCDGDSLVID